MILSVLDQSPVRAGGTAADALNETVELAKASERWGYHRYWLAEHHATEGLAGSAPEIMVARVAAATSAMRVGSGGVMLSHYSPLKVAETFRVLETLYPGRIDLGIGRAPGSDQLTARALQAGPGAAPLEYFPNQVQDLLGYLGDGLPAEHPFARIHVTPEPASRPEVWLLGSSDQSGMVAAYLGCGFSFAHFINDQGGPQVMEAYRRQFRPSAQPRGAARQHRRLRSPRRHRGGGSAHRQEPRSLAPPSRSGLSGADPHCRRGRSASLYAGGAAPHRRQPPAHGDRHAGAGQGAAGRSRRAIRRRGARRRQHLLRLRGAPPIL